MNYPDYKPEVATDPLTDAELAALDDQLQSLPGDAVMNVEALDGYLTGLLVAPLPLAGRPGAAWLPVVWGGDAAGDEARPFASVKQKKKAVLQVLRHLRSVDLALRTARRDPAAWEPVLSVAESPGGDDLADAEDWCAGFLQAVALDPERWSPLFDDAETGPALVPIGLLGMDPAELSPADAARLADPAERDALSRAAMDGVLLLAARAGRQP
jgi:uncharacterized protein